MTMKKSILSPALLSLFPARAEVRHPTSAKGSVACKGRTAKVLDAVALVSKNPDLHLLLLFEQKLKPAEVKALVDNPTPELQKPRSVA